MRNENFDFEQCVSTPNGKWSLDPNVIPLMIADMDFMPPPCLTRAFSKYIHEHNFGYSINALTPEDPLRYVIQAYHAQHQDWHFDTQDIVFTLGHVSSFGVILEALTQPGEAVLLMPPDFEQFQFMIERTGRRCQSVMQKQVKNGSTLEYTLDVEHLAQVLSSEHKLLVVSHPNNPTGLVISPSQWRKVVDLCVRNRTWIISSEVWAGLILSGQSHQPIANLSLKASQQTITLSGVSKTFGVSGLHFGYLIISNPDLRAVIEESFSRLFYDWAIKTNFFGRVGMMALLEEGEPWRLSVIEVIKHNRDLIQSFLASELPQVAYTDNQAGYFTWLDFSGLGHHNPIHKLRAQGKIALTWGSDHHVIPNQQFARLCYACPSQQLEVVLGRMEQSLRIQR